MITKDTNIHLPIRHLDAAPFPAIVCFGEDLKIEFANALALPLLKSARVDSKTKLQDAFPEIFPAEVVQGIIDKCFSRNETYTIKDRQLLSSNGHNVTVGWKDVTITPLNDEHGKAFGVTVYFLDVPKIMGKGINGIEALLGNLFRQAPLALVCYRGEEFIVDFANEQALQMWGRSAEEVKGKPIHEIFPEVLTNPAINARHNESIRRLKAGETHVENEVELVFVRQGKPHRGWYNYIHEPYSDSSGKIIGMLAIAIEVTEQVRAKQALIESEARFRNILEQTPEPMIVFKGENMIVDVANEPLLRTWRTDKRVIGKPLLECLPEVRGQGVMEMLLDVYHNKTLIKGYDRPVAYDRGNGITETLYYNFVYTPYVDGNGDVTGVLVIGTDVTSSVLARQKLEESESRFRIIFETVGVSLWEEDFSAVGDALDHLKAQGVTDLKSYLADHPAFVEHCMGLVKVTDVNQATLQMFEAETKEQLLGNLPKIFSRDTMHIFVNELLAISENRRELISETPLNTIKGKQVFTMFHMRLPDSGKLDRVLFTVLDLTARKLAEEELKESESRFRSLIEEAPVATCLFVGQEFLIDVANEKMLEHLGKGNSVLGKPLAEALPELKDQQIMTILRNVFKSGEAYSPHAVPVKVEKEEKILTSYFDYTFKPLRNKAGEVYAIIEMCVDVTQQVVTNQHLKESESRLKDLVAERTKELERINLELSRSNEDLQQFAHVASHDLKEPIRKITTFIDRLKAEAQGLLPATSRNYLDKIERAAGRMMNMVEGVLNYSALDTLGEEKVRVNLNEVISNIEYDLEIPIQQKKARLIYGNLPEIEGAPILIFQLFYNLVNNSLKFKDSSRDLVISITSSEVNESGIRYALIVVRDNGIGFESKYAEKIFETFTRLNPKDQYEGTGLGLSLCQKIVVRHNGKIWASGEPGVGAVFYIQLPIRVVAK